MNSEISFLVSQMKDTYDGNPWYGRSIRELLNEVDESIAFQKTSGQHSIVELLWHMCTWKAFTISRLLENETKTVQQFEEEDWRVLDHSNQNLWKEGIAEFDRMHHELLHILGKQDDSILDNTVKGRDYNFRHLLNGIIQHDIYHAGQIAYVWKMLRREV